MQDDTRGQSKSYTTKELTELLGHTPAERSEETLTHNANNAVTAGIWRIRAGSLSTVLKVVSPPGVRATSEEWNSSEDPSHWNYWEREALAYERGVTSVYSAAGISGPRLLSLNRRPNGEVSLRQRRELPEALDSQGDPRITLGARNPGKRVVIVTDVDRTTHIGIRCLRQVFFLSPPAASYRSRVHHTK